MQVTIGNNRAIDVRVQTNQPTQTTIVNPKEATNNRIHMAEILDIDVTNLQDGYAIVYNVLTQKYEMRPSVASNTIFGGTF